MKALRFVGIIAVGALAASCTGFAVERAEREAFDCGADNAPITRRQVMNKACVCTPTAVLPATCERVVADVFGLVSQGPSRRSPAPLPYAANLPAFMVIYNANCWGAPGDRTSGVDHARCDRVIDEIEALAGTR